ncbi:hypothetical protein, partial [Nocardia sp. NPDC003648]
MDLGELVQGEALVLVDAAVSEPVVDLRDLLVVGVGEVGAEQPGVVAAGTGDGVAWRGWQRRAVAEIVGADFPQEVQGVAVVHGRIVTDGTRIGLRVVDQIFGIRVDLRQRSHVVGERTGQIVEIAARGPVRQCLGQRGGVQRQATAWQPEMRCERVTCRVDRGGVERAQQLRPTTGLDPRSRRTMWEIV